LRQSNADGPGRGIISVAEPHVGNEEVDAVRDVLLSGRYASGPLVEKFEREFAAWVGTRHAVAVNSGTAALHIALESLGVEPGDEVIVPALTFFATVSSVLYVQARPVFVDIEEDDLCISVDGIRKSITPKTRAIIAVHLFGAPARINEIVTLSADHNVRVIEDCAQAHGTEYEGRRVGSLGEAGAFSFFATKHMTTGEGGMIVTNKEDVARDCRIIRNHGMIDRDTHVRLGFNNRMSEISAAMGTVQLKRLDQLNTARIRNSRYLIEGLKEIQWAKVPEPLSGNITHTYFWCPLMIKDGAADDVERLKNHLNRNGIQFRHRYREPLYRQPALRSCGLDYSRVCLPIAEKIAGKVIGIPNHAGLQRCDLDRIIEVLHRF